MTREEAKEREFIILYSLKSADNPQDKCDLCNHAIVGELVRCKDCKHHHYSSDNVPYCDRQDYGYGWKDDDYCSRGERREDGEA